MCYIYIYIYISAIDQGWQGTPKLSQGKADLSENILLLYICIVHGKRFHGGVSRRGCLLARASPPNQPRSPAF